MIDGNGNDLIPRFIIEDAIGVSKVEQMEDDIVAMINRKMPNCHFAANPKRNLGRMIFRASKVQKSKP